MKTSKVYISGPISGRPDGNQAAFMDAAILILSRGDYPVNPHDVGYFLPPGSSWTAYMKVDIPALCESDSIYMLRGWWRSRGARLEWMMAKALGYKVEYQKMKEIRREHYNGNTFTIPKNKQENLDNYDKFCAYLKNCAASSGFQFIGIGVEISRCVEAWNHHIGYEKSRKKEIVINEIMTIEGAFPAFKKWFHDDYLKRNLYA